MCPLRFRGKDEGRILNINYWTPWLNPLPCSSKLNEAYGDGHDFMHIFYFLDLLIEIFVCFCEPFTHYLWISHRVLYPLLK